MYAFAEESQATIAAKGFLDKINDFVLYPLIIFLTALALLLFLYGAMMFVINANNPAKRTEGKKHMIFGIIGLLVMTSAYTILLIAANTVGIPST